MSDAPRGEIDVELVRSRLSMADLCAREGVVLKRQGAWLVGLCPFHEEKSGSFQIGSKTPHRATCRGCGVTVDIFEFWMKRHDVDFRAALEQLASLTGVIPSISGVKWKKPKAKSVPLVAPAPKLNEEKPHHPKFRQLTEVEMASLAQLRGLSFEGVRVAARAFRRVGAVAWKQRERCAVHGWDCWLKRDDCVGDNNWKPMHNRCWPSWVVTDDERRVCEYRRLDGELYPVKNGEGIKTYSTAGKAWPLGAAELGKRRCVLMVEGGPDMLAAYHFLWGFEMLPHVAVVCMLGAGNRIAEEALDYFDGTRVRIMMDEDTEKRVKTGKGEKWMKPGAEAAARWTQQLTMAGASVETFSLRGLRRADGKLVKDLNDLALCNANVVTSLDIREAFTEWKEGFGG
jgi:hypothetical protein